MAPRPFNSKKMQWLNAICSETGVGHVAFRVAYTIGDHFNSVTREAWPSHERVAQRVGVTAKTVQRAVRELESQGWLFVKRAKGRMATNRYRLRWPDHRAEPSGLPGPKGGQDDAKKPDVDVPQSYLVNLLKTYSKGSREGQPYFPDRGLYEQRIIHRFGPVAEEALTALHKQDPALLSAVCLAEKEHGLSVPDMNAVHRHVISLQTNGGTFARSSDQRPRFHRCIITTSPPKDL